MRHLLKTIYRLAVLAFLTALTQIGGIAYLIGMLFGRSRFRVLAISFAAYAVLTVLVVPPLAQSFGRLRLPCSSDGDGPVVAATWLTCALNRGYLAPQALVAVTALGADVAQKFPGSKLTTLEAGFPFIDGFPLIPHISHRNGKKVDLAYFYRNASDGSAIAHGSPSPIGYFVFEQPKPGEKISCSTPSPLRWNFHWAQPASPAWVIDEERTAFVLRWLKERGNVYRIFIEPYLAERMGVAGGKVRFQGCRAARHDDHIHIDVE